jgi:hypothetical protein
MALVRRLIKDSPLTFAEGDANLVYLEGLAINTGSFAVTTDSNSFSGSQIITGSLTFFRGGVTGSLFGTASNAVSASYALSSSYSLSGSFVQNARSSSYAVTSSYADNFLVKNTITAQTLVVTIISSSVIYSSGSNIFGNSLANTHQFTGSLQVTGSNNYILSDLSIGTTALAPYGEKLFIQGDASTSSAVITTSANSGISTLSVVVDRGLQGGVALIADKTNQLGIVKTNNSDFWPLVFQVRGSDGTLERMRISSTGGVGIGTTSLTGYNLRVLKNITGATSAYGISSEGTIQSDVTYQTRGFSTFLGTQATAFNSTFIFHYLANQGTIGAGSSIDTQIGFQVESSLIGATTNIGFQSQIPSGTNRWNLYMSGTANNYMAGSLGIGTTGLTNINLAMSKNISGSTTSYGIYSNGTIQSGVTTAAIYNVAFINTAAASFTVNAAYAYYAGGSTIGAGSAISQQHGFYVHSSLVGATVNYAYRSALSASTGVWNLYMDGSAQNFLSGSLGLGSGKSIPTAQLDISGSALITGSLNVTNNINITSGSINITTGSISIAGANILNTALAYSIIFG